MRQFAGFGTPEETNRRFKLLLEKGQTGLSVAYDMPTLIGYDPDHSLSLGEVGKCGVSVFHIGDMESCTQQLLLNPPSNLQSHEKLLFQTTCSALSTNTYRYCKLWLQRVEK